MDFWAWQCSGHGKTLIPLHVAIGSRTPRNMYLAAAEYFKSRMADSQWLQDHFLSGITTASALTNLAGMIILTKMHQNASYPKRIVSSLTLNTVVFCFLTLSTIAFLDARSEQYYGFLISMDVLSSVGTALIQNGLFAYVTGFGIDAYTQGILAGQGVAGVLPGIVQIITVLSVSTGEATAREETRKSSSAFLYFLTATGITSVSLLAFLYLANRHARRRKARGLHKSTSVPNDQSAIHNSSVSLLSIAWKLRWFGPSLFLGFCISMIYPVFTQKILSVRPADSAARVFQPECFIPLGFLVWNVGDFLGKMLPLLPAFRIDRSPRLVFLAALSRLGFIPLYLLCNIKGEGAAVNSDLFYLVVVQLLFGATNGIIGTVCMMAAPNWVDPREQEAAGSFMSSCLVAGLTVGSMLSFSIA